MSLVRRFFEAAARADRIGVTATRVGLIVVLLWIGGLKAFPYEADGIVPFMANSPAMSFLYRYQAPEYTKHMNKEGELIPANRAWHEENRTYLFSYGLGAVIVLFGLMLCLHPWKPGIAAVASFMVVGMSFVTLSFLITTPETWVPPLGDAHHGFPYLSGRGRLVIKDIIMLGAAIVTMADSARAYLAVAAEPCPDRSRTCRRPASSPKPLKVQAELSCSSAGDLRAAVTDQRMPITAKRHQSRLPTKHR